MSLAQQGPAAAGFATIALLIAVPASAETPNSPQAGTPPKIVSNTAPGDGATVTLAEESTPTIGTATTTETAGSATGTGLAPKAANALK